MQSAALTILVPAVVAGYSLYSATAGAAKPVSLSLQNVIEGGLVPLGFGWMCGYLAARYGGLNNPLAVGGIAGAGVWVFQKYLMADVDSEVNSLL